MSDTTDRINEENSKKRFEQLREQGEQVESKLNLINEYNETLVEVGKAHKEHDDLQKQRILKLAKLLDRANDMPKQKICAQVCKDLEQFGIDDRYIQKMLPDEYKRHYEKQMRPRPELIGNDPAQKKPIEVTNDGSQTIPQPSPLDDVYGGKTHEQMKREEEITRQKANEEIQEDKEGTMENPSNMLRETENPAKESVVNNNITTQQPMSLLSDKSPEFRDLEAKYIEEKQIAAEQTALAKKNGDEAFKLKRILVASKSGALLEELKRIKVENSNLKTQMSDVDRDTLAKEGYKEVEVFKLQQDTIRMLQEVSSKSERTFFLLVHPKTMQIKAAKTDKEMHRIQALRNVGAI